MLTVLSSEFPNAPRVFEEILKKVNGKGKVTYNHLSQLLKRVGLSTQSISSEEYKEIEKNSISIDRILIGQSSSVECVKSGILRASLRTALNKVHLSDIEALKEEKCEEGKRKAEDYQNRLKEAVTPKEEAITRQWSRIDMYKVNIEYYLNKLPDDKKLLAKKYMNKENFGVFEEGSGQMAEHFPGTYIPKRYNYGLGVWVVEKRRIGTADEKNWIAAGREGEKCRDLGRIIKKQESEVKRLLDVKTDSLHFPIPTYEQTKLLSESDRSRRETAWDYELKELVVNRLNAISKNS